MIPGLGNKSANAIDAFVNKVCANPPDFGELEQLRRLFTWRFRRGLERLLNGSLNRVGLPTVCDVQIGWIDKIPVARSRSLSSGTELGDAVLFAFDERRDLQGNLVNSAARAAILQAKIATLKKQIEAPAVPVGSSTSTPDELALLSAWPIFDLHATGRSKAKLIQGVNIGPSCSPSPHAWFIAAPGRAPAGSSGWPCWWMAGATASGAACATTLGELIVAFLAPSTSRVQVGFPFKRQLPGTSAGPSANSDWSDLCNEIWQIAKNYTAPPKLFGPSKNVFGPMHPRIYSIPRWATSFLSAAPSGRVAIIDSAAGLHDGTPLWHKTSPFRPVPLGSPIAPSKKRGMFIVAITVTSFLAE